MWHRANHRRPGATAGGGAAAPGVAGAFGAAAVAYDAGADLRGDAAVHPGGRSGLPFDTRRSCPCVAGREAAHGLAASRPDSRPRTAWTG